MELKMKLAVCRVRHWSGKGGSGRERAMHPVRACGSVTSGNKTGYQRYHCPPPGHA